MLERTGPDEVRAEIGGQDGRNVHDVHGNRGGGRPRRASCRDAGEVEGGGRAGPRERGRDLRAQTAAGTIHTAAQITGKAASMGEGVVVSVLDALIKDFTGKLANI